MESFLFGAQISCMNQLPFKRGHRNRPYSGICHVPTQSGITESMKIDVKCTVPQCRIVKLPITANVKSENNVLLNSAYF